MDLDNLLHLFSTSGQKIDALWEFYVTVHVAIFGGLFIYHKMQKHQLIITLISYIAFSLINLRAKIFEYKFYNSVLEEIGVNSDKLGDNINSFFSAYSLDDRATITYIVHAVSFLFILVLAFKAKEIKINADKGPK